MLNQFKQGSRNILVVGAVIAALGIAVAGVSFLDFLDQPDHNQLSTLRVKNTDSLESGVAGAQTTETPASEAFSYRGEEGKTALELLRENYNIETEEYSFGEMVVSINGVAAGEGEFWAFYVDGEMSEVGAGELVTSDGQLLEWKLEKAN